MRKETTCFFTGHRRIANNRLESIKYELEKNIETLIEEYGVDTFISGAALGFDTIAAESVIKLRDKYPHIRLVLYLRCYGQSVKWDDMAKFRYRMLLSKADEYRYITESNYTDGCMQIRNMSMIRDSSFCIAFCVLQRSGTGLTLRHAEALGLDIRNIADEIY